MKVPSSQDFGPGNAGLTAPFQSSHDLTMEIGTAVLKRYVEILLDVDRAQQKLDSFYDSDSYEADTETGYTAAGDRRLALLEHRVKEAALEAEARLRILKEWGRLRFPNLENFVRKNW